MITKSTVKDFRDTLNQIDDLTSPEGRSAIDQFWNRHIEITEKDLPELKRRAFPTPIGKQVRSAISTWLRMWADRIDR
jgi:hypothetical protein